MAVLEFTCKFTNGIKYGDSLQIFCDVIDLSQMKCSWEPLLCSIFFDRDVRTLDVLLGFRDVKGAHSSIKRIDFKLQLYCLKATIDGTVPAFIVLHLRKLI